MTAWRRQTRFVAWSLCAVLLGGCRPSRPALTPVSEGSPGVTRALRQLQRDLDETLAVRSLESGTWGISIRSLKYDDFLYSRNSRKLLMPASSLKIVTLAAAAERLGWDHVYETRVLGVGTIDSGTLNGDLIVHGTGDPSLVDEDGSAPEAFRSWADRLKSQGVQTLSGRIIGDDSAFDDEPLGAGWMWDDLAYGYSAGVGPLQLNRGAARLTVKAAPAVGEVALAALSSDHTGMSVRSRVGTAPADSTPEISVRRSADGTVLSVFGSLPVGAEPIVRSMAVANPTLYFVGELRRALIANGLDIRGPAVDIDELTGAPPAGDAVELVSHRSPPLSVLADTLMKLSQNQYAEALVKTLGAAAGDGSFEGGRTVVMEMLQGWGVATSDLVMADGSGLSRYNLITADALVTVLSHVHRDGRLKESFEAALPAAGRSGTLADRLADARTVGVIHAKTGSMANVRSIAGYMRTADAEPVAFSIIANNYGIPGSEIERVTDAILTRVAAFSR